MIRHTQFQVHTRGRSLHELTDVVRECMATAEIGDGLAHIFVHHTSASLIVCENADADVRRDLDAFFARLAPDGDPNYLHKMEGEDDMSAHIRTVLTLTSLAVPIVAGRLDLGTWQGIYLWEHRTTPHVRKVTVSLQG